MFGATFTILIYKVACFSKKPFPKISPHQSKMNGFSTFLPLAFEQFHLNLTVLRKTRRYESCIHFYTLNKFRGRIILSSPSVDDTSTTLFVPLRHPLSFIHFRTTHHPKQITTLTIKVSGITRNSYLQETFGSRSIPPCWPSPNRPVDCIMH